MSVQETAEQRKWKIEDAARTLIRAKEIKQDKGLYSDAIKEFRRQQEAAADVLEMTAKGKIKHGLNLNRIGR